MNTKLFAFLLLISALLGCDATSDTSKSANVAGTEKNTEDLPKDGIVNWTALVVRESPSDKGKYITSVYQGEKLTLLGAVEEDSISGKGNVYANVELSDGTKGWVLERFVAAEAKPAAISQETEVYKRPDLLTRSEDKFYRMDFVAVKEINGDWIQVVGVPQGKTWYTEGWIKADKITEDPVDISFAVLANRAAQEKDEQKKSEEINMLLSNTDFQNSRFYADFNEQHTEEQPVEHIEEYAESADDSVSTDDI